MKKKLKIAFVLRTVGLEYDDRVRKECISLSDHADVELFVNFSDNREEKGITSYGVPYVSYKLKSRDIFPSAKFLIIKAYNFYWAAKKDIADFDIVWAHEEYAFMFPLLLGRNKCIWDLHEIPFHFEKPGLRTIFKYIERKSRKLIHANQYRINYLESVGLIKDRSKHEYINNYPDQKFINSEMKDDKYSDFIEWLGDSSYVYLQGLSISRRHPVNTIEAVLSQPQLKAVVVGGFDEKAYNHLYQKYGETLSDRIYFKGKVNQLAIPSYIRQSLFSIVLYDIKTPNNRYCEPNRLYQALVLGKPVVVGCNEPMKNLIAKYNFGISIKSDGENLEELAAAVTALSKNLEKYQAQILKHKDKIMWESNFSYANLLE